MTPKTTQSSIYTNNWNYNDKTTAKTMMPNVILKLRAVMAERPCIADFNVGRMQSCLELLSDYGNMTTTTTYNWTSSARGSPWMGEMKARHDARFNSNSNNNMIIRCRRPVSTATEATWRGEAGGEVLLSLYGIWWPPPLGVENSGKFWINPKILKNPKYWQICLKGECVRLG